MLNRRKKTLTEIKREPVTRENLEECVKDVFNKCIRRLNAAEARLDGTSKLLYSRIDQFGQLRKTVIDSLDSYESKMEQIEELFFILYHNIQKNQFLYSNEEEAWWHEYIDLKNHYSKDLKD